MERQLVTRFDPADLIESRRDAGQTLLGAALWIFGAAALIGGGVFGTFWPAVVAVPAGMLGVLTMMDVSQRASRRLKPDGLGAFARWRFDSEMGQQWIRPAVLRHAVEVLRQRE